jgi:ubiquitin conjugation factor E4 B
MCPFAVLAVDPVYSRHSPESFDLSGKNELVLFALTFLTSTWYIKNPFLKAKINEVS